MLELTSLYNTNINCDKSSYSLKIVTEEEKRFSIPTQAAIRLRKSIFESNRNITGYN